jgi:hypothetical protein
MMRVPAAVIQSDSIASGYIVPMATAYAVNLRTLFDTFYPGASLVSGDEINFNGTGTIVGTSAMLGSNAPGVPSLTRGSWPAGVVVKVNNLIVLGRGGVSGDADSAWRDGGDAVNCSSGPIIFNSCYLAAGGGAGRAVTYDGSSWTNGGGGAGYSQGAGNPMSTLTQGGVTTSGGGSGGDLGQPGSNSSYGPLVASIAAGAAGYAIVGSANATLNSCTVIGATV